MIESKELVRFGRMQVMQVGAMGGGGGERERNESAGHVRTENRTSSELPGQPID